RSEGRSEAMRQVQLAVLHTKGREHPWAPFIVSGDDRTLDDKPAIPDLRVHPGGACACRAGHQPIEAAVACAVVGARVLEMVRRRARAGDPRRPGPRLRLVTFYLPCTRNT